jgi:hypothetical protein
MRAPISAQTLRAAKAIRLRGRAHVAASRRWTADRHRCQTNSATAATPTERPARTKRHPLPNQPTHQRVHVDSATATASLVAPIRRAGRDAQQCVRLQRQSFAPWLAPTKGNDHAFRSMVAPLLQSAHRDHERITRDVLTIGAEEPRCRRQSCRRALPQPDRTRSRCAIAFPIPSTSDGGRGAPLQWRHLSDPRRPLLLARCGSRRRLGLAPASISARYPAGRRPHA